MKAIKKILSFSLICAALVAAPAAAEDIEFNFDVTIISNPPEILNISSSTPISGNPSFTVVAEIVGQEQKKGFCDVIPESECTTSDWYQAPDPDVVPNPPTIQWARVYYYINDDVASASGVDMTYDSGLGRYRADIPLAGAVDGDTFSYYIVAVDSAGNVASQVPDKTQRPCPSSSSWDDTLSTPAISSCSYATSYEQCGEIISGQPSPCAADEYTLADKQGDVCGEPDSNGNQSLISGTSADKVDILGMSAGADSTYFCANIGIPQTPPEPSDPPPIEVYELIIFNPDIPDLNPADTHIENAYVITYAPEAVGSDPTLVKDLWDADCVTDPNTSNPLDCKLISPVGYSEDLKIEYTMSSLRFMTKRSGTGNPYNVSINLIGSTSQSAILKMITGEINLSGGTAFWTTDSTPGFRFYHYSQIPPVVPPGAPAAPIMTGTICGDGPYSICRKTVPQLPENTCTISFKATLDAAFTDEYRIYRNNTDNYSTATMIGFVEDQDGVSSYSYEDTHTTLDGTRYYYYITSYNSTGDKETPMSEAAGATCTVEDWPPPLSPSITNAATPPGATGKCRIDWTMDEDPSLRYFYISRDFAPLNYENPLLASEGVTDYSFTDPQNLAIGESYAYTVTAIDLGENTAESSPVACTPEDLKAPDRANSLIATNSPGKLGVEMDWAASAEDDLAGYNVYYCPQSNPLVDCREQAEFARMNSSLITDTHYKKDSTQAPSIITGEGNYCFYIEACDDCDSQGTCPANGGTPNCSGYPPGGADSSRYVKCLTLTQGGGENPPAWPGGLACNASAEGNRIIVEWDRVCYYANGDQFEDAYGYPNCATPTPEQVVGYKVIFGDAGLIPSASYAGAGDIAGITSVGIPTEIAHSNLNNGQQYCYNVTAIDAGGNFSIDGPGGTKLEVCCTPQDTLAPDKPEMQVIPYTSISCTPTWYADQDKDDLAYSVYRCDGDSTECTSGGDFTSITTGITGDGPLNYADYDVTTDETYTYCVTAVDESGNQSAVYESGDIANCRQCVASGRPKPTTDVGAAVMATGIGAKVFWTNSVDDDGGGGYNVYRCADTDTGCSSPTAVQTCVDGDRTPADPLILQDEPCGEWYYGVTYMTDCGDPATESFLADVKPAISAPDINIPCPYPDCETQCIIVSSCKDYDAANSCVPVTVVDTAQTDEDGKYLTTGKSGLDVFLADSGGDLLGGTSATTDTDGNFKLVINNAVAGLSTSETYRLILRVPAAQKSGIACSPGFSGDDCYIILSKEVTIEEDATVKVSGLSLGGGGRAEIGNADCSDSVDVGDLLIMKAAFGASVGDSDYRTYADFDGNGTIDVEDFLILKKNFGKILDAAPSTAPGLCKE